MNADEHSNESCVSYNDSKQSANGIESHMHENALVCSVERNIYGDLEAIKTKVTSELALLAEWVEEQGGITGHIKALVEVKSHGYMLSTTGGEVEIKDINSSDIHVSIVTIVFKVDKKEMECRIASLVNVL